MNGLRWVRLNDLIFIVLLYHLRACFSYEDRPFKSASFCNDPQIVFPCARSINSCMEQHSPLQTKSLSNNKSNLYNVNTRKRYLYSFLYMFDSNRLFYMFDSNIWETVSMRRIRLNGIVKLKLWTFLKKFLVKNILVTTLEQGILHSFFLFLKMLLLIMRCHNSLSKHTYPPMWKMWLNQRHSHKKYLWTIFWYASPPRTFLTPHWQHWSNCRDTLKSISGKSKKFWQ